MRVLVCGGRSILPGSPFRAKLFDVLDRLLPGVVIHGDSAGADALARAYAEERGIPEAVFPAKWTAHGKMAGPLRNQWMLTFGEPDVVVALPGGKGTADMVRRAENAGVPIIYLETCGASVLNGLIEKVRSGKKP